MGKEHSIAVSIIIPTLNEEKVIGGALAQFNGLDLYKHHHLQIIVSDGGSNDNTLKIAKNKADLVLEADPGVRQTIALGRNLGAAKASGKVLLFLDADVRLRDPAHFISTIIDGFEVDDRLVAIACKVNTDIAEQTRKDRLFHGLINLGFGVATKLHIAAGRGECQIIRKSSFEAIGGYRSNLVAGEDTELYRRLKQIGHISFDRNLVVFESPRRFRKQGYLKTLWQWNLNNVSVVFRKKAHSKHWEQVR
jgi:glycosyltransferase involved in cell wall biosynthesis